MYEALNLVNGERSVSEIRNWLMAELGPVPMDYVSQYHLGRVTAMDAATMQGVIKRLTSRNLILRRSDPDDRRRLILSLSRAGRALINRLLSNGGKITERTLTPLSQDEQKIFLQLLTKIAAIK